MIKQLRQFGANVWLLALVLLASPVLSYGQTIEYYHLDALGSVRAVSNQAGEVVERHDYLPFGEEDLSSSGSQSLRFTSKERDRESGFDYFGARYYAARAARFTTVDPAMEIERNIADPQNWNRYAYARNNPLKNVDPDGRSWWAVIEAAFTVNDLRDARQTLRDPNLSSWDRGATIVGTALGAVAPGGAYGPVLRKLDDAASQLARTAVVQRAMSRAELAATQASGLLRGGRQGTHYVSDAISLDAKRARQRLALPVEPEVRVTMRVPADALSPPSPVQPLGLRGNRVLPGGGSERTTFGRVPATVTRVQEMKR